MGADAVVFATGANDVVPLFENNDTPGIFGPRGLRLFLERDGLVPGSNAVVYGPGTLALDAVELLRAHGVTIAAVAFTGDAENVEDSERTIAGACLVRVRGRTWVSGADFVARSRRQRVACDLVCIALPGQPAFELPHQAGFRFAFPRTAPVADPGEQVMIPVARTVESGTNRHYVVGEAAGIDDWREALEDAARAGAAAAEGV